MLSLAAIYPFAVSVLLGAIISLTTTVISFIYLVSWLVPTDCQVLPG
jgi:hypothetical protein